MIILGEKKFPWHVGLTIKEVLKMAGINHTSILVIVNDMVILQDDWETSLIPDESKIRISPMISGG